MTDKKKLLGFISYIIKNLGQTYPNYEWKDYLSQHMKASDIENESSSTLQIISSNMYYAYIISLNTSMGVLDVLNRLEDSENMLKYLKEEKLLRKKFGFKLNDVEYYESEEKSLEHMNKFQSSLEFLRKLFASPIKKTVAKKKSSIASTSPKISKKTVSKSPITSPKISKTVAKSPKNRSVKKNTSPKKKESVLKSPNEGEVTMVLGYSDKANVLYGDFGGKYIKFKDEFLLKEKSWIKPNSHLKDGFGWIFAKTALNINKLRKALNEYEIEYVTVNSSESPIKKVGKSKSPIKDKIIKKVESSVKKQVSEKLKSCSSYTVKELKEMAKNEDIKGRSKMGKDELCKALKIK